MQTINREKITRYFTQKESTGSGGGSGDSGDLIAWVNDNFVSKNFFNQLFTIHGHDEDDTSTPPEDVIVTPNDTQTIIDSIEAMFDFYSEKAISALGLNSQGGGGGASTLADLNDVDLTTPTNGQVLMYNSTTGKWYNGTVQGGGVGTVTSIVAGTGLSGGTITTSGTIALSSETQTDIGKGVTAYGWGNHANAGYLTSSDISDMATQTWVGQNYLGLHSTADKATKLATARTLWGQSFDGTANVTGSLTDVINITGSGTLHRFTSMELNSQGDLSGYGGYIDYHYNGGGTDYTSRLVEESVGVLSLKSKTAADVTTLAGLIVGSAVDGSFVQVGSVRLVYDSTNNAIKVVGSDGTTAANFYATGAVSALGANSQSGGSGLTMDDVWDALGNGSGPDGGRQINASHVSYALFGYATQTWVNNQSFAKGVKVGSTTYSPDSNGIVDLGTISSTDTKNTVGSTTLNATQLYLVITSAPASGGTYTQSYINTNCYIGTDNCLYSNGTKVLTSETYKGTVTGIAVGSGNPYTPTNGIVGLPAYPDVSNYLPLTGGTLTNSDSILYLSSTSANSYIYFKSTVSGTSAIRASIGYYNNFAFISNENTFARIGVADDGTPQYWTSFTGNTKYTLIHSGNVGTFGYLPLTGGTLSGALTISSGGLTLGSGNVSVAGTATFGGNVTASGFVVSNKTGFLKADGTVDTNTYLTSDADTKNTAGATALNATMLYFVGANTQSANPQTYTNSGVYVDASNYFHSYVHYMTSGSGWIYTRYKSDDEFWDIGTNKTAGGPSNAGFGIRQNGEDYNGIYIRRDTSSYGKLVVCVPSGECSVGFLSGTENKWTIGYTGSNNQFGWFYSVRGGWKMTLGSDGTLTASKFVKSGGTSSQFLKADGSVDSNTYLTSGDVVTVATDQTITGKKTFTTQFTTNGNAALTKGAKFYSICVETDSTGAFDSAREGEINRFGSNDLHLQYASGTGGVTVCQSKLKFSLVQGVVNMTTNSAALYLNTGSTAPTTAVAWSTTSDIRRKDVIRNVDARIEQIAEAPIFDYYLKGGDNGQPFLGTSAQYWLGVFPNAVRMGYDSFYGQDYGATALAAAVITARKVVNHEERIAALERENEKLRK